MQDLLVRGLKVFRKAVFGYDSMPALIALPAADEAQRCRRTCWQLPEFEVLHGARGDQGLLGVVQHIALQMTSKP